MIFRLYKIITGVILVSSVTSNSAFIISGSKNNRLLHESNLIMESLDGALSYLIKRPESVTEDVVLGVLIAKANLEWIHKRQKLYFPLEFWTKRQLDLLFRKCHEVIEIRKPSKLLLLNESLWEDAAGNLKEGCLNNNGEFSLPEFDSCESIEAYMMKGTPNNSDFCINELLSSDCRVSESCWFSELNKDSHSGYKTSHRLLYFQVAHKMKCEEIHPRKFSRITARKLQLCQQMFLESVALFKKQTISVIRDLFMEQIALCGLEGYEEFAPGLWRDQLRAWQSFNGCFGLGKNFKTCSVEEFKNNFTTAKRTDLVIDDCHTHVTAVAVSTLAFFVRVTLNKAFSLPVEQFTENV